MMKYILFAVGMAIVIGMFMLWGCDLTKPNCSASLPPGTPCQQSW